MGFPRQYWGGLQFPGDLPNPGIEPVSPASHALAGGFLTTAVIMYGNTSLGSRDQQGHVWRSLFCWSHYLTTLSWSHPPIFRGNCDEAFWGLCLVTGSLSGPLLTWICYYLDIGNLVLEENGFLCLSMNWSLPFISLPQGGHWNTGEMWENGGSFHSFASGINRFRRDKISTTTFRQCFGLFPTRAWQFAKQMVIIGVVASYFHFPQLTLCWNY